MSDDPASKEAFRWELNRIDILDRLKNCAIISPMTARDAANEIEVLRASLAARELGADKLLAECRDEIQRLRQLIATLQDDGA
jgi:hypothetical protein